MHLCIQIGEVSKCIYIYCIYTILTCPLESEFFILEYPSGGYIIW